MGHPATFKGELCYNYIDGSHYEDYNHTSNYELDSTATVVVLIISTITITTAATRKQL